MEELRLNSSIPFCSLVFQIPVGQFSGCDIVLWIALLAAVVDRTVLFDNAQTEEAFGIALHALRSPAAKVGDLVRGVDRKGGAHFESSEGLCDEDIRYTGLGIGILGCIGQVHDHLGHGGYVETSLAHIGHCAEDGDHAVGTLTQREAGAEVGTELEIRNMINRLRVFCYKWFWRDIGISSLVSYQQDKTAQQ